MIIPANQLKPLLRKISHSKSDVFLLDTDLGMMVAQDNDLIIQVSADFLVGKAVEKIRRAVLPLRKTVAFLNRLSGDILCSIQEQRVVFKSGKTTGEIEILDQQFSVPTRSTKGGEFAGIKDPVDFVLKATGEKLNAFSSGVLIDGTRVVATDNTRMAIYEASSDLVSQPIQLPLAAAQALKLLEAPVFVKDAGSRIELHDKTGTSLYAKKFSSSFPDYKKVIPSDSEFIGSFDCREFSEMLSRVAPLLEGKDGPQPVNLTFNGTLQLSAKGFKDEIDYALIHPDPVDSEFSVFEAVLDHRHLTDVFNSWADYSAIIIKGSDKKPVLLDAGDKKFLMMVMK